MHLLYYMDRCTPKDIHMNREVCGRTCLEGLLEDSKGVCTRQSDGKAQEGKQSPRKESHSIYSDLCLHIHLISSVSTSYDPLSFHFALWDTEYGKHFSQPE